MAKKRGNGHAQDRRQLIELLAVHALLLSMLLAQVIRSGQTHQNR